MTVFKDEGSKTPEQMRASETRKRLGRAAKEMGLGSVRELVELADRHEDDKRAYERQELEVARSIRQRDAAIKKFDKETEHEQIKLAVLLRREYRSDPQRCLASAEFIESVADMLKGYETAPSALRIVLDQIVRDLAAKSERGF